MSEKFECSSFRCDSYGCNHCEECSHAIFFGEGKGKTSRVWRWQFNPIFGPLFVRKDGISLANQPWERSPAWKVFDKWYRKGKRIKEIIKEIRKEIGE